MLRLVELFSVDCLRGVDGLCPLGELRWNTRLFGTEKTKSISLF